MSCIKIIDRMKILLLCFLLPVVCYSQTDTICVQRGHVQPDVVGTTLLYCPPYLIESDTITIKVYPSCNLLMYTCLRCDKYIEEYEEEQRVVIWRKPKE